MALTRGVLLGTLLLTGVAWAQEACFCLKDPYGSWLRGCREGTFGPAKQPATFCTNPATGEHQRLDQEQLKGWSRVEADQDGCIPCDDRRSRGETGPRTGDPSAGGQHDSASPTTQPVSK